MPTASVQAWFPTPVDPHPEPDTTLSEFFTPAFMRQYTRYETFEAFVGASPWSRDALESGDGPPPEELDRFVARTTEFDRWTAMRNRAAEREVRQRLLF